MRGMRDHVFLPHVWSRTSERVHEDEVVMVVNVRRCMSRFKRDEVTLWRGEF